MTKTCRLNLSFNTKPSCGITTSSSSNTVDSSSINSATLLIYTIQMYLMIILAFSGAVVFGTIYCFTNKIPGEPEEPVRWLFMSEFNLKIAKGDYDKIKSE